ncbi:hypothetical protein DXG01_007495 [Tephrocybe rancida]|nr:hypothetical protein DXG01_007495 [Tephrocybe rancida]
MPSFRTILAFIVAAFAIASSAAPVAPNPADVTTLNNNKRLVIDVDSDIKVDLGTSGLNMEIRGASKRNLSPDQITALIAKGLSTDQIAALIAKGLSLDQIIALAPGVTGKTSKHDEIANLSLGAELDRLSAEPFDAELAGLLDGVGPSKRDFSPEQIAAFVAGGLSPEQIATLTGVTRSA